MLNKTFKYIKKLFIIKYSFVIPKKKVIFFDEVGFEGYKHHFDYVIDSNNFFVLKTREQNLDVVYISIKLILNVIFYLLKRSNFKVAYLSSLILEIKPKIVITNIDNSIDFSLVAKNLYKQINFLAIQNAARYEFDEPFYDKNLLKKHFIPEFACFSEYEKYLYTKHRIFVKKFLILGSLKLSDYLHQKRSNLKKKYDICLILEESKGWDKLYPGFEDAIGKIANYTKRIALENNYKIVIAGKRKDVIGRNKEREFYSKYIKSDFDILLNNKYSSYEAMENSNVTVGMMSTILREGLALKSKILACNFTGWNGWDFPIKGLCQLTDIRYSIFKERIQNIISKDFTQYTQTFSHKPSYIMDFRENNSPYNKLKSRILSILNEEHKN